MIQRSSFVGRRLLAGSCLLAFAALSQPALAQQTTAPQRDAASDNEGIQDIVVTARFVAENVQDTPIAITAATQAKLESANVSNVGELGRVIPNLRTIPGDSQSAGTPVIRLRGVVQGASSSLATPPALGIYTDDIYHGTTAGSELDFTDVERLEVNRGPQSTLSGNASIGGSIKLYTVDPKGDGSGYLEITGGSRKHMEFAGALDLGLSPTLSVRASGHFKRQDGFGNRLDFACEMDKLGTPALRGTFPYAQPDSKNRDCIIGHTGGGTMAVGQIKLRWQPTDGVDFMITARHREENMEETPEVTYGFQPSCAPGFNGQTAATCLAKGVSSPLQTLYIMTMANFGVITDSRFVPPARNGGIYDTYATNCRPNYNLTGVPQGGSAGLPASYPLGYCYKQGKDAHNTLVSARLKVDISDKVHMTAIGGYTNYSNEFTQNGDQSPLGLVISHFRNYDHQWSGELRFDGKLFDDKLQWVAGLFAVDITGAQRNSLSYSNVFQLADVYGTMKSQSAFFHLDYSITDRWRVSGGGRWSHTDNHFQTVNPQTAIPTVTDLGFAKEKRIDWLISTDYKITDDIMVYASAATGSRPPGVFTIVNTPRQYGPTGSEELIAYEAGLKSDWFDKKLRSNMAVFYTDYKKVSAGRTGTECRNQPGTTATFFDVQQGTPEAITICSQFPGAPSPITYIIGGSVPATVRGAEWEVTALPFHGLKLEYSIGTNKYISGIKTPGQTGYLYPGTNHWVWNQHGNVSYDLETSAGTFTPSVDWAWQGWQQYDPSVNSPTAAFPLGHQPEEIFVIHPYSLFNGQLAYEAPDRSWSARFTVTNLANHYYHYQVLRGTINAQTRVGEPRTWSLSVKKTF
ncbi:TonB-dependent receptor [Sphingobium nicotianae]|uniref:TonB-dependent receptor n=1 Tax=Sphingobium nicotianae TaxID=2782607 RepID=A0A9X1DAL1_9SPHN|nr:TonB-dependent receptor [Sphingobium nicotianae]MBT2186442.1 TonB-dependent receptor [Sphingobium nicotianae]